MFAIFLTEGMTPFVHNITSFPTVFFTFILGIVVLYWLVAVLGMVEIDVLDIDGLDVDGGDGQVETGSVLAGLMIRLGLNGVPVTIIISFIALFGWLISYYAVHFLAPFMGNGILRFVIGLPVLLAALYAAAMITSVVIKPLRPLFKSAQQETVKYLLGQTAVVRTLRVDANFGEATLADGGAGLILKVRAIGDQTFTKGDRVVLLEHVEESGFYRVVSEEEFAAPV